MYYICSSDFRHGDEVTSDEIDKAHIKNVSKTTLHDYNI